MFYNYGAKKNAYTAFEKIMSTKVLKGSFQTLRFDNTVHKKDSQQAGIRLRGIWNPEVAFPRRIVLDSGPIGDT